MNEPRTLLEIYDPPACCPGGMCGPDIDPAVVEVFETLMRFMSEHAEAVEVRRYFLPTDLHKVKGDAAHRERLMKWQAQALFPVTLVEGEIVKTQRYASYEELLALTRISSDSKLEEGDNR